MQRYDFFSNIGEKDFAVPATARQKKSGRGTCPNRNPGYLHAFSVYGRLGTSVPFVGIGCFFLKFFQPEHACVMISEPL